MIQHVVLFKWKDEIPPETIDRAIHDLESLREIEGVCDFAAGKNFARNSQGYSYALVLRLPDRTALKAYWPHPLHERVLAVVQPLVADVLIVDFEI
jgi:hypothetical protein